MIEHILHLMTTIDSGATISLLNPGVNGEQVGAALRSAKRTLSEAQTFVSLLASIMGVELPAE